MEGIETRVAIRSHGITTDRLVAALDLSEWRTVDEIIERIGVPENARGSLEIVMRVRRLLAGLKLLGLVDGWSINHMNNADITFYTPKDSAKDFELRACRERVDFDFLYRLRCSLDQIPSVEESIVLDRSTF